MQKQNKKSNEVIVYSTPTCPYCDKAKNYLEEKGVEFEDYNVAANKKKAKEMIEKTDQKGVPVLDVNGEIIVGFSKGKIDQALN